MNFLFPNEIFYTDIITNLNHIFQNHQDFLNFNFKPSFLNAELSLPFNYVNGGPLNTVNGNDFLDASTINLLSQKNILFRYYINCANPFLVKADLQDIYTNLILTEYENGSNIIVSSLDWYTKDLLNKYPNYKVMASEDYFLYNDKPEIELYSAGFKCHKKDLEEIKKYQIPKNKIWINLVDSCQTCSSYSKCKKEEQQAQIMFSTNSSFLNCNKFNFTMLTIKQFIELGYTNFWFDFSGISQSDINSQLIIFLNTFIKPEYQFQADLILRGLQK